MRLTSLPCVVLMVFVEIWPARADALTPAPMATAPFDLKGLAGTWFEIAHIPCVLERGHVASKNTYEILKDGHLRVCHSYQEGFHQQEKMICAPIRVDAKGDPRDLHIWLYHLLPIHQYVTELAPDKSWLLITTPGHDLAWILARSPKMERGQYQSLVTKLRDEYGVYTDKLQRVPQFAEQENQLGFEAPLIP